MGPNSMRVLHVVPSFFPAVRYGGPIFTVLRLCQAVQQAGVEVDVATTDADGRERLRVAPGVFHFVEGVPVRYFRRDLPVDYAPSAELARWLPEGVRGYDLVHITSTFSYPALVAAYAARRAGIPYVVSPRGSLQRWSLEQKGWKKRPYWLLVEAYGLRHAAAIHVTSAMEAEELNEVLPGAHTFITPNGVDLPSPPGRTARVDGRVLFLGRLHPKKGLDVLVRAMSLVARARPGAELVVAGPDDVREWERVTAILGVLEPRPSVRWVGPVEGREKEELLASARVFALASHGENFGQAVAEALAAGTPAVVSRNTPWAELEGAGAGAWVENTPEDFAAALLRVLSDPGWEVMSAAAREVAGQYAWPSVGRRMAEAYRQVIEERTAAR